MSKKTNTGKFYNKKWFILALMLFLLLIIASIIWIFVETTQKIGPLELGITEVERLRPRSIFLTGEEKNYLERLGIIRFAVNPDWEPFEMIANGVHSGIAADLIALVTERLGIRMELVITRNWQESLDASRDGRVQVLAFLNSTTEREAWLLFTESYFSDSTAIITRHAHPYITDLADLPDKTVVLPAGSRLEEQIRNDYPHLHILLVPRVIDAFRAVETGEADFALHSLTTAIYTMREEGLFNLKIAGKVPQYENKFRMGIIKQEPLLSAILNKGIATITVQDVQRIKNQYIAVNLQTPLNKKLIIWLSIILITLLGIGLTWIYLLHKMNRRLSAQEIALRDSQSMLAYIIEHDVSGVAVLDSQLKFIYVSQKYSEVFQLQGNLIGRLHQNVHLHTPDYLEHSFREALAGRPTQGTEDACIRWDDVPIWIRWKTRPWFLNDNSVGGLIFYVENITDRIDAEAALLASEEKFRLITEYSSDVIWILNMSTYKFTYISPAIEQLRGYSVEEALQQNLETSLTHRSYREVQKTFAGKLEEFLQNPRKPHVHYIELQQPCKDGSVIWVEISVKYRLNRGGQVEAVGVTRNIEARKKAEARIRYLSYYDQLTGLYNRRYYEEQLLKIDVAQNYPLTLVMADVNGLKYANDILGHQIGDELLITVAKILTQRIRVYDLAARIGGDEYIILMPKTTFQVAEELINGLDSALRKIKIGSLPISVAFGWATKESAEDDINDIFKEAEDMMYIRKRVEQTSSFSCNPN